MDNPIIVALDLHSQQKALELAEKLAPLVGAFKVGKQLFISSGPDVVRKLRATGAKVFLDLKLHDIPNTVRSAARVLGTSGARWVTVHTSGGAPMLQAAVEGLTEGAASVGSTIPGALGVTILTSDDVAGAEVLTARCELAATSGCEGIVCAAPDLPTTDPWSDRLVRVVPGIRMPGGATHDQARVATPREALAAGADLLVVGRAVTAADDPVQAATDLAAHLAG